MLTFFMCLVLSMFHWMNKSYWSDALKCMLMRLLRVEKRKWRSLSIGKLCWKFGLMRGTNRWSLSNLLNSSFHVWCTLSSSLISKRTMQHVSCLLLSNLAITKCCNMQNAFFLFVITPWLVKLQIMMRTNLDSELIKRKKSYITHFILSVFQNENFI